MKTIFKNGAYERVSNEMAEIKTKNGWKYVPKQEWKQNKKPEVVIENPTKDVDNSKKLQRRKKLKSKQY